MKANEQGRFSLFLVVLIVVVLILGGVGIHMGIRAFGTDPLPPPPHDTVWIEFENIQHALDVAGRLGGMKRGLTVCVGSDIDAKNPNLWVPPHVKLSGEGPWCRYQKPPRAVSAITMSDHDEVSHMAIVTIGDSVTIKGGTVFRDNFIQKEDAKP